jgi:ribosome-associated translation inhibitor RaiA
MSDRSVQWVDGRREARTRVARLRPEQTRDSTRGPSVVVVTQGEVTDAEVEYAVRRIETVLDHLGGPLLFARLKLARAADPARERPATAQATLDLGGEVVRAHVAAADVRAAADLVQQRLRSQLQHRAQHRQARRHRTGTPAPGEWRHGDRPRHRPDVVERPVDERQLVRHKSFTTEELTPDEAAFDLSQLDHDIHLYRDLATGDDTVLEQREDGRFELTRLHPADADLGPVAVDLVVSDLTPPTLTVDQALALLDELDRPHLFFRNAETRRGNVVYRRFDGHYGLLSPAV